jgi:hypothetical protein
MIRAIGALLAGLALACSTAEQPEAVRTLHRAGTDDELRAALTNLTEGDEVVIAPGEYRGGIWLSDLHGSADAPIVIRGADPAAPPVFSGGGSEGWHLSDCSHVELRDLVVRGFAGNGVNVDDAGSIDSPAQGILIDGLTVENTGPEGNHDALKLSGLDGFTIRNSVFRGWGGSAIDMVGCHDGLIESCTLEGREGFSQSSGIQIKGGSARVVVRGCNFTQAGSRAVNIGGSTGKAYFRPLGAAYEAAEIVVEANRFIGSEAPIAFVGAIGCVVRGNRFQYPEKWLLRILQESAGPEFEPCQGGVFEGNHVLFDQRLRVFVNVGAGTLPDTFVCHGNTWVETDAAGQELAAPRIPF